MEDIKHIIESLLFVADEPLTVDRLKKILNQAESGEIREAMAELTAEYEARGEGFILTKSQVVIRSAPVPNTRIGSKSSFSRNRCVSASRPSKHWSLLPINNPSSAATSNICGALTAVV